MSNLTRDDLANGIAHRLEHQSERHGGRPTILTEDQLTPIPTLVKQGRSAAEIADELGWSIGTLRVRCSQFGISLRRWPVGGREKIVAALDLVPAVAKPPPVAEFLLGICAPAKRVDYVVDDMNERFLRECERYCEMAILGAGCKIDWAAGYQGNRPRPEVGLCGRGDQTAIVGLMSLSSLSTGRGLHHLPRLTSN
jgi:hypothetical protein